jgi:hypothetical protein
MHNYECGCVQASEEPDYVVQETSMSVVKTARPRLIERVARALPHRGGMDQCGTNTFNGSAPTRGERVVVYPGEERLRA